MHSLLDLTFLGLDVHRDSISVATLGPELEVPTVDKIFNDEPSIRRVIGRFPDRSRLRVCYEAGPTGFELHRLLTSMGVRCEVIAPSLIPKAPGDRVKTDKRDCRRLARLHRAGELTAIRVPTPAEEAVRDLCRTREDMVTDLVRARHRLTKFLLRHDQIYRDGSAWTIKHEQWLSTRHFDEPALTATFAHYRAVLASRQAELRAPESDLAGYFTTGPFADAVARLSAYRGITQLGALTLASEVGDWRRFASAPAFMGFTGLVPSEYSSGQSQSRGHLTKTGNTHLRTQLVESAWAYQHHPSIGPRLQQSHTGVPPATISRSWTAQQRLCARFRTLSARKNVRTVVVTAIARELAGFVWAEMTADTTSDHHNTAG
jgi:transposase